MKWACFLLIRRIPEEATYPNVGNAIIAHYDLGGYDTQPFWWTIRNLLSVWQRLRLL